MITNIQTMKEKKEEVKEVPKDIVGRHLTETGMLRVGNALVELESMVRDLSIRLAASEEALAFFANWYNRTQETNILVPEHLANSDKPKIIL